MGRSLKKGPYVDQKLLGKVQANKEAGERRPIRTWSRACTIHPDFVGMKFNVHNGKQFIEILVNEDMVGHKLGEFSPSRTFRGHIVGAKAKA